MKPTKYDKGKAPFTWIAPFRFVLGDVAKVFATSKYAHKKDNWKYVENGEQRYVDAALRHLLAYADDEKTDPESGFSHLVHVICNCLMADMRRRLKR